MRVDGDDLGIVTRIVGSARTGAFFLVSALYLLVVILVALVRPRSSSWYSLARAWADWGLSWFGVGVETSGLGHLERGRDYVVLANHRSLFDPFAIICAFEDRETRWVAKRELARVPIFGSALRVTGQILIDRRNRDAAIGELRRHLGCRGNSVVFFPEGHRAPGTELLPFKKGGAGFAIDAGLPLVPVAISGSEKALPYGSLLARPGVIRVRVGEPFDVSSGDREAVTQRARDAIQAMLDEVEPQTRELERDRTPNV